MSEINKAIPQYILDAYPTEESIDPVSAVTALLTEAGHPEPNKWIAGLDDRASNQMFDQNSRRFLVNRYWRPILGMVEEDTTIARYCIMDEGSMYIWLLLFKESVIPVIVKHQLPNLNW